MKILNYRKFINRRNFWNEQAPSTKIIYIDAVNTRRSTVDFTGSQTDIISCSILNNNRQAQKCNLPNALLRQSEAK